MIQDTMSKLQSAGIKISSEMKIPPKPSDFEKKENCFSESDEVITLNLESETNQTLTLSHNPKAAFASRQQERSQRRRELWQLDVPEEAQQNPITRTLILTKPNFKY